jgi:hypothetical protein
MRVAQVAVLAFWIVGACAYDFDALKAPGSAGSSGGTLPEAGAGGADAGGSQVGGGEVGGAEAGVADASAGSGGGGAGAADASAGSGGVGGDARDAAEETAEVPPEASAPDAADARIDDAPNDVRADTSAEGGFDCAAVNGAVYQGHCYWGVINAVSWDNGQNVSCAVADHGGHLVTITSAGEQAFVQSILPSQERWIGLRKPASSEPNEALFHWVTSETYSASTSYRNWVPGDAGTAEPNFTSDSGGGMDVDCVLLRTTGFWADDACPANGGGGKKRASICEHE